MRRFKVKSVNLTGLGEKQRSCVMRLTEILGVASHDTLLEFPHPADPVNLRVSDEDIEKQSLAAIAPAPGKP